MLYYKCRKDLVCGAKGTLYTTAEMHKYQLDTGNKSAFERVRIPEYKTVIEYGIRRIRL